MASNRRSGPSYVSCGGYSQLVKSLKTVGSKQEHIVLAQMKFDKPIKGLPVLPLANQVSFIDTVIKHHSILQFDQWCPNITELAFLRVKFSDGAFEKFTENALPAVKVLTFSYEKYMEELDDFLEEIDEKFPSLEELTLVVDAANDLEGIEPTWDDGQPYESRFFENLTNLSLTAFGDEGDKIFDYMCISNEKLEELSFESTWFSKENLKWIKRCEQLSKLTLGCPYFEGSDLKHLKGMANLKELYLDVGMFDWDPKKMVKFIQRNGQLKLLSIESERNNKEVTFDDEFKKMFSELAQERDGVTIKVTFGKGETMRQMKISKDDFDEKMPIIELDSDDDTDDDSYSEDDSWEEVDDEDETESSDGEE